MKNIFRRFSRKSADSFDQVDKMVTRELPIPDLEGSNIYIQFKAEREKDGLWKIRSFTNLKNVTSGLQAVGQAYQKAVAKHFGKHVEKYKDLCLNFDTALLILRDMEESLLRHSGAHAGDEPARHYMAAYRLLPQSFREGLDELAQSRAEKHGEILPSKAKAPAPAEKAPSQARPGGPAPN